MGIPEPKDTCEVLQREEWLNIDLVIVPGLGYDLHGGRIGYGGGYYDRFAEQLEAECFKAGKSRFWLHSSCRDNCRMTFRWTRLICVWIC